MVSIKSRTGTPKGTGFWRIPVWRHFWVLVALIMLCVFTGGGSRGDITSLIVLRPLSLLAACYGLWYAGSTATRDVTTLLWLLIALAALIGLQLIPLPFGLWSSLPERQVVAENDSILGIGETWRPLTLTPGRTLNSLFSLGVPLAVVLLYRLLDPRGRVQLVGVWLTVGAISAIWGAAQLLAGSQSSLYNYAISNVGMPIGMFSNRNHQAIFLASLLPLLAWFANDPGDAFRRVPLSLRRTMASGLALLILAIIVLSGSRMGLLLTAIAAVFAGVQVFLALSRARRAKKNVARVPRTRAFVISAVAFAAIVAFFGLTLAMSRSAAFDRLFATDVASESRYLVFPQLIEMVQAYFPFGSGFGSFQYAYYAFEKSDQLSIVYLNQAHFDYLQILIEAGIFGALVVLAGFWLLISPAPGAVREAFSEKGSTLRLACLMALAIPALGSFTDYPARVPVTMAYLASLACLYLDRALEYPGEIEAKRRRSRSRR